jgi:hypothetical protein
MCSTASDFLIGRVCGAWAPVEHAVLLHCRHIEVGATTLVNVAPGRAA